jgi:cob(I)alamin adenosyltransferase
MARTVARRAERCCVSLARSERVDPFILRYLNRLSDLCFVLARYVNSLGGRAESHPTFGRR